MPVYTIYVLQRTSITGLPTESGSGADPGGIGTATGGPSHTITVNDSNWIPITVNDTSNEFFNELNGSPGREYGSQTLVNPVTLNGVTYPAGYRIFTAYDLINTSSGLQVTSFHIGTNDNLSVTGQVMGIVSYGPLPPGTYTFDAENSSLNVNNLYADTICFCRGTHILTSEGERAVESLAVGDKVETRDHGVQPIRWIGSMRVMGRGKTAPIKISAGALSEFSDGAEVIPSCDLFVSPQHRMLISNWRAELMFGKTDVLVAAKHLVNDKTIYAVQSDDVEYFHILFDNHEVIFANGAAAETLHPGKQALDSLSKDSRDEILALFPELADGDSKPELSFPDLKAYEGQVFARLN